MKKIYIHIMMLAALVVAGAAMTSCQKEEAITGKFNMTVKATKGGGNAKALSLDPNNEHTLNATWAEGEQVTVYKGTTPLGTLTAQSDGDETTLYGTIESPSEDPIVQDDVLTLKFCSDNYSNQDGTLGYIAANCDYATATVTVTSVGDGKVNTGNSSKVEFENQQAIVKFTLKKATDDAISATQLIVNDGTKDYTITPASGTSEIYVAIPGFSGKTVTLAATVGSDTYIFEKSGVTFTNGQYYEITVKMNEYNLAKATTADLGKVIGADGNIYDNVTAANACSEAVAIIAYVGSAGSVDASSTRFKGLALALTDIGTRQWFTATSGSCSSHLSKKTNDAITWKDGIASTNKLTLTSDGHTHAAASACKNLSTTCPSGTSGWFLPDVGQWNLIVQGLATKKAGYTISTNLADKSNNTYTASNLNSVITDAGGTGFVSNTYWASTEFSTSSAWAMYFNDGCGYPSYVSKKTNTNVRAVFAF